MSKTAGKKRAAKSGRFVRLTRKNKRGEYYEVAGEPGSGPRTVITSSSSASTLDAIVVNHKDALKRLAKK